MRSAISIDVDALRFYGRIHGLDAFDVDPDPIYETALPRFFELLTEVGVPGTVFFIAEDLSRAERTLRAGLQSTGSELASHSYHHDYRLSRRGRAAIAQDLRAADAALSPLTADGRIWGFRAPGYTTSAALLETVVELEYAYDSSLLPAPSYFAARAVAIAAYAARGRPSSSTVGDARAFLGPRGPYRCRPDRPWRPDASGPLIELPMAVEPLTRLPLIGTTWVLLPPRLRDMLLHRALRRSEAFVFEMHAIDLLDGTDPGIPQELIEAQPDLRRPAKEKIQAFRQLFRALRDRSQTCTLVHLARAQR